MLFRIQMLLCNVNVQVLEFFVSKQEYICLLPPKIVSLQPFLSVSKYYFYLTEFCSAYRLFSPYFS